MKSIYLLFPACLFLTGCFKFGGDDCGAPNTKNDPTVFINMIGNDQFCPEVSEGFTLRLDWPYITGDDGGDRTFNFEGTEGFLVEGGETTNLNTARITLIATEDSPEEATIEVYAHNACGESNRGIAQVKVRKTPPYLFLTGVELPQPITQAATFVYQGKGYVAGGLRGSTAGTDGVWEIDPSNRSLEVKSPVLYGAEEAAAVVGDTAYISRNGGRLFQVYHIPTNTRVREMHKENVNSDIFFNQISMFAKGDKIYIGPISPFAKIMSYNVSTGEFKDEKLFDQLSGIVCKTAFYHDNRIYYFFENGAGVSYNPTLNSVAYFNTPFNVNETAVTSFSLGGKAYVVSEDAVYLFDPAINSMTKLNVFNGNICFTSGWNGHKWSTNNFVLGEKVYFVGGQDVKQGAAKMDFFGVKL